MKIGVDVDQLEKLKLPFSAHDIEWRVQRSGFSLGNPWLQVIPYLTSRAVQDRLDLVCGPHNWRNEFQSGPDGGVLCGISIYVSGVGWLQKWDGAENTKIEPIKGGLSGATKRAAVQWGIGRYLYSIEVSFGVVAKKGRFRDNVGKGDDKKLVRWNPPELPAWAVPGSSGEPTPDDLSRSLPEYMQRFDLFKSIEEADTWAENHWPKVQEDLDDKDHKKASSYFEQAKKTISEGG